MSRWMVVCLLLLIACSDEPARSASLSLPENSDSTGGPQAEAPTLVLRCHNGQVSAYMVTGSPAEIATDQALEDAVEIQLDSAPPCDENAP